MKILLGYQSYQGDSPSAVGQRAVNMYAEKNPDIAGLTASQHKGMQFMVGAKYPWTMFRTPGQDLWLDMGSNSSIQGAQQMGGLLYVVTGNTVYKVTSAGVKTSLGSISGTGGRVDMCNNGTQMTIVADDNTGWVATSSALAKITDVNFPGASSCAYMQGFGLFSTPNSSQFFLSASYDMTTYNSVFASMINDPNPLVRVSSFNNGLWLFTAQAYEVWGNYGSSPNPFQLISGDANTTRGLAAKFSVAQDDNTMFMLADDLVVYRFVGVTPQRISTPAIESAIQKIKNAGTVADAIGFTYTQRGHKFYVLTFPTGGGTFVYDISQGFWHERLSFNSSRWNPNTIVSFAGKILVGDYANGKIYALNTDTKTDDGQPIQRIVQGAVMWEEATRITHDYIYLDIDGGVGLATGQGQDPQVAMTYSDDGGNTWSNEKWRSFGKQGAYKTRPVWRGQGQSRQRIYKWEISDPVDVRINGAYGNFRIGRP